MKGFPMKRTVAALLLVGQFCAASLYAQALNYSLDSKQSHAVLNGGVSYDLLRAPTSVSFDYPEGYLSFNIPLDLTSSKLDLGASLKGSNEKFTPEVGARQRLNFAFRINVPMLKGVLSYAQTENVNFDLSMNLGTVLNTDTVIYPDASNPTDMARMTLTGAINLPIRYQMGWRTQTFGYAFKPIRDMVVAVNFHKHLFELTANGTLNTNVLGNIFMDMPSKKMTGENLNISYSEDKVFGQVSGNFKGTAWSPAIGIKWWRLTLTSRVGVNAKVNGDFTMRWHTPFFINPAPKSFGFNQDTLMVTKMNSFKDANGQTDLPALTAAFTTLKDNLKNSATDSFVMVTKKPMEFNIPSGETITFEAWKKHIYLSYTLIHGGAISGYHQNEDGITDFDLGLNVNHFLVLNLLAGQTRFTVGAFLLDVYESSNKNWLSKSTGFSSLGGVPIPITSFATSFGSTARVLLELDVLPIPALKTGLVYYF